MIRMRCEACGETMVERVATVEAPYRYELSGLPDVYLAGILVRQCPKCEAESPVIPRVMDLHRAIARTLAQKPTALRGDEVRFLRKFAGFSGRHFAALLAIDPSHLSRVERGHVKALGPSTDRLARAVAVATLDGDTAREVLLWLAEKKLSSSLRPPRAPAPRRPARRPIFHLVKRKGWEPSAA